LLIVLDSNIICSNFYMEGPSFEVAQRVGTIVLGQIVVDEVCNKFKEKEANAGDGLKVHPGLRFYFKYILPLIIAFIVCYGIISYF